MSKSFLDLLHVGEWEMSWMSFIHLSCVYLPSLKFSLLCVHVYKMGGCYVVHVKIRGHLSEAGSPPLLYGSQEWS